jgi:hypothetical protein
MKYLILFKYVIVYLVYLYFIEEVRDGPTVSAIAEAKLCSQWSVIGWVTKIYYLELLRSSEGTLSRWSLVAFAVVITHSSFKEG